MAECVCVRARVCTRAPTRLSSKRGRVFWAPDGLKREFNSEEVKMKMV